MKLDLTSKYILAIVGIVAVVGIVVMIMNNSFSTLSGQAMMKSTETGFCTDSDDWYSHPTEMKGTTSGNLISRISSRTDFCSSDEVLKEYYCENNDIKSYTVDCSSEDMVCSEGACVPPGSRY